MLFTDRNITCSDCGVDFMFSAAEQEFFEQKGFRFPRRCKECRKAKKDGGGGGGSRPEGGGGFRSEGGGGFSSEGGGGSRGEGGGARAGGAGTGETWPANCTQCGAETTVPFKPDPARPTFCRKCYGERKTSRSR